MSQFLTLAAIAAAVFAVVYIFGVTKGSETPAPGERVRCRHCDRLAMEGDTICEECWANQNSW